MIDHVKDNGNTSTQFPGVDVDIVLTQGLYYAVLGELFLFRGLSMS